MKVDVSWKTVALAAVLVAGAVGSIALGYEEAAPFVTVLGTFLRGS